MDFRKSACFPVALALVISLIVTPSTLYAQGTGTPPPNSGNSGQGSGSGSVTPGGDSQASTIALIDQAGGSEAEQSTMDSFQREVLSNLSTSDPIYLLFNEASGNGELLEELAEDFLPEIAGADVVNITTIQSATFGNISSRAAVARTGIGSGDMFVKERVWAQLLHSKATQDRRQDIDGFHAHTSGVTAGVDGELNDHWILGTALTYAQGKTNSKSSSNSTETNSYLGSIYASWQKGIWYTDIMASAGRSNNKGERLNGLADSDYDSDQYAFRIDVGYSQWLEAQRVLIQPSLSFNYGRVDIDAYQEEGSAAALNIKAQRYEVIEVGLGVKAVKTYTFRNNDVELSFSMNGWHDFAKDQVETQSRFVSGTTLITTNGAKPESTSWQAGLGIEHKINSQLVVSLNHDYLQRQTFRANTTQAKVRYDF